MSNKSNKGKHPNSIANLLKGQKNGILGTFASSNELRQKSKELFGEALKKLKEILTETDDPRIVVQIVDKTGKYGVGAKVEVFIGAQDYADMAIAAYMRVHGVQGLEEYRDALIEELAALSTSNSIDDLEIDDSKDDS